MPQYQIVNPKIEGTFTDTYDAKTPLEGGGKFWKEFSKHIGGHVPHFKYSMKDVSTAKYYHYTANENEDGEYSIEHYTSPIDTSKFDDFTNRITNHKQNIEQQGGKKHKHSSSSDSSSNTYSSSDSSSYRPRYKRTSPISYVSYMPFIYTGTSDSTANPRLGVLQVAPIYVPRFSLSSGINFLIY
jgi:hypothetical protein